MAEFTYDWEERDDERSFSGFLVCPHGDYTANVDVTASGRVLWSVHFIGESQLGDTRLAEDYAASLTEAVQCCHDCIGRHRAETRPRG